MENPKHFCLTGKMSKTRHQIESIIAAEGSFVTGSIKYADYLIVGNMSQFAGNMTSKLRHALDHNWPNQGKVITEHQLYIILGVDATYATHSVKNASKHNYKAYVDHHVKNAGKTPVTYGNPGGPPAQPLKAKPAKKKQVFLDPAEGSKSKNKPENQLPDIETKGDRKLTAEDLGVDVSDIFQ